MYTHSTGIVDLQDGVGDNFVAVFSLDQRAACKSYNITTTHSNRDKQLG